MPGLPAQATTTTYSSISTIQTFTVPDGVTSLTVIAVGGAGGRGGSPTGCTSPCRGGESGVAGRVSGTIDVIPGQVISMYPGGAGANGSGANLGAGGTSIYSSGAYNGGNGASARTGNGAGGGGGAATIVTVGGNVLIASGAGGGGGASHLNVTGQNGAAYSLLNSITATKALNAQTTLFDSGAGGGGAGGARAGDPGAAASAKDLVGNGGFAGANSTNSVAGLNANYVNVATGDNGYVQLSYTQLSPYTYDIGDQWLAGGESTPYTVTLTNNGLADQLIKSISLDQLTSTGSGEFSIKNSSTCANSGVVAAGSNCSINIVFDPYTIGAKSARLTVTTDTGTSYVNVTGTGVRHPQAGFTVSADPSSAVQYVPAVADASHSHISVTAAGGSEGAITWAIHAGDPCVITTVDPNANPIDVEITGAGTCSVTATRAQTANYDATDATVDVSVARAAATIADFTKSSVKGTLGIPFAGSQTTTTTSDGLISYSSSDESIATVDSSTGEVTLLAEGDVTISAQVSQTTDFEAPELKSYSIHIKPAVTVSDYLTPLHYTVGQTITSITPVSATGGHDVAYTLLHGAASASLVTDAGLDFNTDTGEISGTPTQSQVRTIYTVKATDVNGSYASGDLTMTVYDAVTTSVDVSSIHVTTGQLVDAVTPVSFSGGYQTTAALLDSNGDDFAQTLLDTYGLTFDPTSGSISGTPTGSIDPSVTLTVAATDSNGSTARSTFTLGISPAVTTTLGEGFADIHMTVGRQIVPIIPVAASGGFNVVYDLLDEQGNSFVDTLRINHGLTFNTSNGQITGTPTSSLPATTLNVRATDANNSAQAKTFTLTIHDSVLLSWSSSARAVSGTVGDALSVGPSDTTGGYRVTYTVTGSNDAPATLPKGLSLNSDTGVISGTPELAFSDINSPMSLTVHATDANGSTSEQTFTIVIDRRVISIAGVGVTNRDYITDNFGVNLSCASASLVNVPSFDQSALDFTCDGATATLNDYDADATDDNVVGTHSSRVSGISLTGSAVENYLLVQPTVSHVVISKATPVIGDFDSATYQSTFASDFNAPTITSNSSSAVVYTSSDSSVAEVNSATGVVTVNKAGSVTISASTPANSNFKSSAVKSYSLNVSRAARTIDFSGVVPATLDYGTNGVVLAASPSAGAGTLTFTRSDLSQNVCSIDPMTGAITLIHAGTCQISADIAQDSQYVSASTSVDIDVKPVAASQVRNLDASVSGSTVVVNWDTPADDGGAEISTYTATVTGGNSSFTCAVNAPTTKCSVSGLRRGTKYSVSVVSENVFNGNVVATSVATNTVPFSVPSSVVAKSSGQIPSRFDPVAPTSLLGSISIQVQQNLVGAGVLAPPADVPVVAITADLSSSSSEVQTQSDVQQDVYSGSELDLSVLLPSDLPVGTRVSATLQLPDGSTISLGSRSVTSNDINRGLDLAPFTIIPPGSYTITLSFGDTTTFMRVRPVNGLIANSGIRVAGHRINFGLNIKSGPDGVPDIAVEPTPTPTETPTPEPTPTDTPTPEPSAADERGLVAVDPMSQPEAVAQTTVTAVTLVSAVSAAASAAAAVGAAAGGAASAAGGAAGGSAGGGGARGGGGSGGSSGGSGSGSSGSSGGSSGGEAGGDVPEMSTIDFEFTEFEDLSANWGDQLPIWGKYKLNALDKPTFDWTIKVAKFSPLLSKLINDGAYLRAMGGIVALLLPLASIALGIMGFLNTGGLLLPPNAPILTAIAVIGIFDAFAGFAGIIVFIVGLSITAGVHTSADIRMLMGLSVVGFGPALLAGSFRGIRRNAALQFGDWWERIVDIAVAPFLGGWAMQSMISSLPSLAGIALPIADHANAIAVAVALALAARVLLEEFVAQYFPGRLNQLHPTEVPTSSNLQKCLALAVRGCLFYFVAGAFIGHNWQLTVGTILFIVPSYLALIQDRLPNFPILYQILPAGLPGLAFSLIVASATLGLLTNVLGSTPNLAKISFVMLPIPSGIMAFLGMLGREPAEGDTRWYQRESLVWVYRIGGLAVFAYTLRLAGLV